MEISAEKGSGSATCDYMGIRVIHLQDGGAWRDGGRHCSSTDTDNVTMVTCHLKHVDDTILTCSTSTHYSVQHTQQLKHEL